MKGLRAWMPTRVSYSCSAGIETPTPRTHLRPSQVPCNSLSLKESRSKCQNPDSFSALFLTRGSRDEGHENCPLQQRHRLRRKHAVAASVGWERERYRLYGARVGGKRAFRHGLLQLP